MQVSVEANGSIQRKMTVTVPADNINQEVEKRLKSMRGKVRMDGFRPGKVPLSVVKQRYGTGIYQEVVGDVMQNSFYDAARQENLRVAGYPSIDPKVMDAGKDLEYEATFDVYPEIEVAAMDGVKVEKPVADIADADIDKMIETLRTQQKEWVDVDREVQDGDLVTVDFEGTIDGEAFEGGDASGYQVEVGAGRMLKDFEAALIGMKAGEEKTSDVAFPENYHAENLKGKTVQFRQKVTVVQASQLPEINEEFINRFGVEGGDMDAFRAEVKKNMQRELDSAVNMKVKTQVMDHLHDKHELEVPAALVTDEISHMREEMKQNTGTDTAQLPDELFTEQATRRVKLGLIVGEVIRQNDIQKDAAKIDEKLETLAATYEDPQALIEYYRSNAQAMQTIEAAVMEDMIVEWVLNQADITEENTTFDDIMNPTQAEA